MSAVDEDRCGEWVTHRGQPTPQNPRGAWRHTVSEECPACAPRCTCPTTELIRAAIQGHIDTAVAAERERIAAEIADKWVAEALAIPRSDSQIDAGIRVTLKTCARELRALTERA